MTMPDRSVRNNCFDLLKGIACVAVVFMHCEFPGQVGVWIQSMTRWSVPLFFAISGYFCRGNTVAECLRKAKHIGKIALGAVTFYVIERTIEHWLLGDLGAFARSEFTPAGVAAFLLFNGQVYVGGHLWFLFALGYAYCALALIIRFNGLRYQRVLCVSLIVMHFALAYGSAWIGRPLHSGFYRNWLFDGLPFLLLGKLFYERSQRWMPVQKERYGEITPFIILTGLLLSIVERQLLGRDFSLHLSSVLTLLGLLAWATRGVVPRTIRGGGIVFLGRELSMYVYIVHVAVYGAFDHLLAATGLSRNTAALWLRPVNALLWSIVISLGIYGAVESRKKRRGGAA